MTTQQQQQQQSKNVSHLLEKAITSDSIHSDNQSTMFSSTINPPLRKQVGSRFHISSELKHSKMRVEIREAEGKLPKGFCVRG
ncbi:hypothetical protein C0Q70_19190 [Pomacea canaliculata]|uniref:Uncharacterized protein n=1 Tax=Pomacea canaliculata TaxID=400727 RepID=A0A2T7NIN5_POMCA|nr:hypothetical protein C0Q70_19190 [Pomacea canaliculata]